VEQRYPFFDRRLVEFCVGVPLEQRLGGGWTRLLMRRAMGGVVPPEVQWRRGKGSLRANARLRLVAEQALVEEALWARGGLIAPYVDLGRVRAAHGRLLADPVGASEEDLFTVFLSAALALWLHRAELEDTPKADGL
jgi:asparagine synthase (glutamine-hydrolysing)